MPSFDLTSIFELSPPVYVEGAYVIIERGTGAAQAFGIEDDIAVHNVIVSGAGAGTVATAVRIAVLHTVAAAIVRRNHHPRFINSRKCMLAEIVGLEVNDGGE